MITGGSRGIGAATTRLLAGAGADVVLVARDTDRLERVAGEVRAQGRDATVIPTDLRDPEQLEALLRHPAAADLDILISNAGISIHRPLAQSLDRPDDVARTIAVNHLAPARLVLGLTPTLRASQGFVVNVSAINVLLPPAPGWAAYQASKAAFDQWLRSTAPELESVGIQVRSVYLPLVRTDMIAPNPAYRNAPAMTPERAAEIIGATLVRRRRNYQPWWTTPATTLASVLRGPTEAAYRRYARTRQKHVP
nr:SDR family NAD(P)-dependent oxidoreductase [Flexivirga oryzae]